MFKNKNCQAIILIISLFITASCSKDYFYSSEVEIPNGKWDMKKAAIFEPAFTDTLQNYNIIISVSNSDEYRYSNLWFFVKTISPVGIPHKDTIQLLLAEENGKWLGKKNGTNWSTNFYFKKQVRFPIKGKYIFEIIQGMRDIELQGITKVGIALEEITKIN